MISLPPGRQNGTSKPQDRLDPTYIPRAARHITHILYTASLSLCCCFFARNDRQAELAFSRRLTQPTTPAAGPHECIFHSSTIPGPNIQKGTPAILLFFPLSLFSIPSANIPAAAAAACLCMTNLCTHHNPEKEYVKFP